MVNGVKTQGQWVKDTRSMGEDTRSMVSRHKVTRSTHNVTGSRHKVTFYIDTHTTKRLQDCVTFFP
jgi:hypothetical protein